MKVAEAYKAGRAKVPAWTRYDLVEADEGAKTKACAVGAFGVGMGLIDPAEVRKTGYLRDGSAARQQFNEGLQDVVIPYKCEHAKQEFYEKEGTVAQVIEHYSDYHRRGLGRDVNLIALMEQYQKN